MGESPNGQIPAEGHRDRYKWVALSNTTLGMLSAVMRAPQSRRFTGYWQRRRGMEPDGGDFFANFA